MGGQTRTDILPYKLLIPVFGFFMSVTCTLNEVKVEKRGTPPQLHLFDLDSVL